MDNPFQRALAEAGVTVQSMLEQPPLCPLGDACEHCHGTEELQVVVRDYIKEDLKTWRVPKPQQACATLCYRCAVNGKMFMQMFGRSGWLDRVARHTQHINAR
jgi:hypothetical protein